MLERDPKIIVRNVVSTGWNAANTPLASAPRFHTGWYDYGSGGAQVTFTNSEESTVEGGVTGITGGTGAGGVAKVRAGTLLVNCWGGSRDDLEDAGDSGARVNPKEAAYQMAREASSILDASNGTTNPNDGRQELLSLTGDGSRDLVDTEGESAVYRTELVARFTYAENTD